MKVWLLHIGEDLPVDGAVRRYRYGYLAEALAARGHDVVRWAPTFRHATKRHRFRGDRRVEIGPHYAIQFVHSPGYRRNVGFQRVRAYRALDRRIRELMSREEPPELLLAAIPSLEWADAAVAYGRARSVPVVVDVRDPWPDVFFQALPLQVRSAGQLLFAPYRRLARQACRGADTLTSVSQQYLDWALLQAGRQAGARDCVLPLGFEPQPVLPAQLSERVAELRRRGVDPRRPVCFFAGVFERSYDLETVVEAARRLQQAGDTDVQGLQFVLCGDGGKLPAIKRLAAALPNIHTLGWVDPIMLQAAASVSTIGLCAYSPRATQSLPNKPFEYMAGRLAIVSSLPGELAELLGRYDCGVTYRAGDASSLAECLMQLLQNPARLATMRANAHRAWSENYRATCLYASFATHLETLTTAVRQAA